MKNKKVSAQFYRQPRYYSNFSCIGGECPQNCCFAWNIPWEAEEVEKLKSAECSEHLKSLIDTAFEPNPEFKDIYTIKFDDTGKCPLLTENNLCSVQKELGEEYLSYTCRIYPRNIWINGGAIYNFCNNSCYHVIDTLCNDKDCMILENVVPSEGNYGSEKSDKKIDIINHPELKYRNQLFEFFYEIISDDSHSLETSIVLGALAAQGLSKIVNSGGYDQIPDYIKNVKVQLNDPKQIEKLESFKAKPEVRLGFSVRLDNLIQKTNIYENIMENGSLSIEKFLEGERKFKEAYSDKTFALRNIALSLLLELRMPFRDKNFSLFENYCYFAAAVADVKYAAAAAYATDNNSDNGFKAMSSYVCRSFAHNDNAVKKVIKLLEIFHCTSPAYLLMILK